MNEIEFQPGSYYISDDYYFVARSRKTSSLNQIIGCLILNKNFKSGSTVTFTPNNSYGVEVFNYNGTIVSTSETTHLISSVSCSPQSGWNRLNIKINFTNEVTNIPNNQVVVVKISGTMTIS